MVEGKSRKQVLGVRTTPSHGEALSFIVVPAKGRLHAETQTRQQFTVQVRGGGQQWGEIDRPAVCLLHAG